MSVTSTGAACHLAVGTLINGSSIFSTGSPSGAGLRTASPAIFGLRFRAAGADLGSAADDTVQFGWARVILTAGAPGTLVDCAFALTPLRRLPASRPV